MATELDVALDAEGAWPDAADALHGTLNRVGLLRKATNTGAPGVLVLVTLSDGRKVIAQTTWRLWLAATEAMGARLEVEAKDELKGSGDSNG